MIFQDLTLIWCFTAVTGYQQVKENLKYALPKIPGYFPGGSTNFSKGKRKMVAG